MNNAVTNAQSSFNNAINNEGNTELRIVIDNIRNFMKSGLINVPTGSGDVIKINQKEVI